MFIQQCLQTYKLVLFCAFFSAFTVILVKMYDNFKINWLLLVAVLSELGLIYGYIQLLETKDILTQFSLVKIISILILVIPSMVFFRTELTTTKIFGIIFGIIAIYLLR